MVMLWLAIVLLVVSVASFVIGFVLYANATGVAPQRRTQDDPTGAKRAASRVEWPDVFHRMRGGFRTILDDNANRSDRRAAVGSLFVLIAILAAFVAVLALLAAFI